MAKSAGYDLLVRIEATTEALRRELNKGERGVETFSRNVNRHLGSIDTSMAKVGTTIRSVMGAFGISVGVGALVNLGKSALQFADDLKDTAAQLGISTEALQTLRFAAEETGVEVGTLDQAILKLNDNIGTAASGNEAAQKKFQQLGISFTDASGKARTAEAVLRDLADVIRRLPTPAERAAAATLLLGDRAARLVPLLAGGAKGLDDFAQAADRMSAETIERLAAAERAIERLGTKLRNAAGGMLDFVAQLVVIDKADAARAVEKINDELATMHNRLQFIREGGLGSGLLSEEGTLKRIVQLEQDRIRMLGILERAQKDDIIAPAGGGGIGLGTTTTIKANRELESALDQVTESLRRQFEVAELNARQGLELETIWRLMDAAQKDYQNGLRDTPLLYQTEIDQAKALVAGISDLADARGDAARAAAITEKHDEALAGTQANTEATQLWASAYGSLESASTNALFGIISGTGDAKSAVLGLLNDLSRLFLQAALFGTGGAGGGILGSLFAGAGNLFAGSTPVNPYSISAVQFRAGGGPVVPGMPYVVGEHGPELMIPNMPGTIIPHGAMGGAAPINVAVGPINVNTNGGGTPAANRDLAEKAASAFERASQRMVEETLVRHMRDRGLLRPAAISAWVS